MFIGEKIRQLRKDRGITQEVLANHLGVKNAAISKYEKGIVSPSWETIVKIATLFNISTNELIAGVDMWNNPTQMENTVWSTEFEKTLNKMGYRIVIAEAHEEEYMYLEYPDGVLEIVPEDIIEINNSTADYIRFKLFELKNKNIKNFRLRKPNFPTNTTENSVENFKDDVEKDRLVIVSGTDGKEYEIPLKEAVRQNLLTPEQLKKYRS